MRRTDGDAPMNGADIDGLANDIVAIEQRLGRIEEGLNALVAEFDDEMEIVADNLGRIVRTLEKIALRLGE